MIGVSFDYGQTLSELDTGFLARRLAERGRAFSPSRLAEAKTGAWAEYNRVKQRGLAGQAAWIALMRAWLLGAGASENEVAGLAEWLWSEQPKRNLWRKPIDGMFELVAELADAGIPLAIVSNSEGKLLELLQELERAHYFGVVVDSGRFDFEKPDPRMFEQAAVALGVPLSGLIHVGDAWEADVVGALGVGAKAVWFSAPDQRELPASVKACQTAAEVRAALRAFGVPVARGA